MKRANGHTPQGPLTMEVLKVEMHETHLDGIFEKLKRINEKLRKRTPSISTRDLPMVVPIRREG